jgi:hypothetical protein
MVLQEQATEYEPENSAKTSEEYLNQKGKKVIQLPQGYSGIFFISSFIGLISPVNQMAATVEEPAGEGDEDAWRPASRRRSAKVWVPVVV